LCNCVGKALRIDGIVQGVGFRPFVYGVAVRLGLTGDVCNTSGGVVVRLFGDMATVARCVEELCGTAPPLAQVTSITVSEIPCEEHGAFRIVPSDGDTERTVVTAPDAALCADCRRELLDPTDRRYRYPFINCTNCGPRYTIILDVPYDRPQTTMAGFTMCAACRAEYESPADRRYHAQPNCCPDCGPRLAYGDATGDAALARAVQALRDGRIVAVKGLGGFHLACDARNEQAVRRLRRRKLRREKPLALMAADYDLAAALIEMPDYARKLLESPAAPVLVGFQRPGADVAPSVAAGNTCYGVMLPHAPLHVLLLRDGPDLLVMTSANRTDEPIVTQNDEAVERLEGIADGLLMHDRPIHARVDDSVVRAHMHGPTIIRRSRGYVPRGIDVGRDVGGIVGLGPMLKNAPAVGRGSVIYPGQHVGDLSNAPALAMHDEVRAHLCSVMGVELRRIACDMHPDYPTTRIAQASGLPVSLVQHHHAHLAGLMAEKGLYDRAIGIALDGTGYGDDGQIWGGEVFAFDPTGYRRAFHLEYVPLPGGDRAAREPWRMALVHLRNAGEDWARYVQQDAARNVAALLDSDLPIFRTSSMGRLFDAVASLCGLVHTSTYEAKAPMALEGALVDTEMSESYDFALDGANIRVGEVIRSIARDVDAGESPGIISARFHNAVVQMMLVCARALRETEGLERVFLSGGCLINGYLSSRGRRVLEADGFEVLTHTLLPPNDGGVAVGEVLVAASSPPA
jgi:hydrogenase maturation protein HypF